MRSWQAAAAALLLGGGTAFGQLAGGGVYRIDLRSPSDAEVARYRLRRELFALPTPPGYGVRAEPVPVIVRYPGPPRTSPVVQGYWSRDVLGPGVGPADAFRAAPDTGPPHRAYRGQYGLFHPEPYYIPNVPPAETVPHGRPSAFVRYPRYGTGAPVVLFR